MERKPPPDKLDKLKHFSKDPPDVKLKALLLWQLPWIFWSLGSLIAAATTAYLVWGR